MSQAVTCNLANPFPANTNFSERGNYKEILHRVDTAHVFVLMNICVCVYLIVNI